MAFDFCKIKIIWNLSPFRPFNISYLTPIPSYCCFSCCWLVLRDSFSNKFVLRRDMRRPQHNFYSIIKFAKLTTTTQSWKTKAEKKLNKNSFNFNERFFFSRQRDTFELPTANIDTRCVLTLFQFFFSLEKSYGLKIFDKTEISSEVLIGFLFGFFNNE